MFANSDENNVVTEETKARIQVCCYVFTYYVYVYIPCYVYVIVTCYITRLWYMLHIYVTLQVTFLRIHNQVKILKRGTLDFTSQMVSK